MTAINGSIPPVALPAIPGTGAHKSPSAIDADGDTDGSTSSVSSATKGTLPKDTTVTPGSNVSTAEAATQTSYPRGPAATLNLSTAAQALLGGNQ